MLLYCKSTNVVKTWEAPLFEVDDGVIAKDHELKAYAYVSIVRIQDACFIPVRRMLRILVDAGVVDRPHQDDNTAPDELSAAQRKPVSVSERCEQEAILTDLVRSEFSPCFYFVPTSCGSMSTREVSDSLTSKRSVGTKVST